MIWNDNKPKQKQEEMSWYQFGFSMFAVFAVGCALWFYNHEAQIRRWYYFNYENLWLLVGIVFAIVCFAIMWKIESGTEELTKNYMKLLPFRKSNGGIRVAKTNEDVTLFLPNKDRLGQVQILGSTGRGKTFNLIAPWAVRDLVANNSTVIIDGKGEPDLAEKIGAAAVRSNTEARIFDLGNPEESCTINPLAHGSAQQITDRIFTAFEFPDAYYKSVQYDVTLSVITLLTEVHEGPGDAVTFKRLYRVLTDDALLTDLVGKTKDEMLSHKLTRFLADSRKDRDQKLAGVISHIGPFATGEVAKLLNGPDGVRINFNVSDIMLRKDEGPRAFVLLIPTLKYQALGHQIGKLVLQELGWAIGVRASERGQTRAFTSVFLDEFSGFVYEGFINILNKARSCGVALHLSHQALSDLSAVSESFAQGVNTNTNVKCLLGLNDPDTADFFSKHIGTFTTEKKTERAQKSFWSSNERTGDYSIREVEAYKVHPNELKDFTHGQGVLHLPARGGTITQVVQFLPLSYEDGV